MSAAPSLELPVADLIRTRRAIRRFTDQAVPEELVGEILEAGRWAPSPANLQPTRFIWVRDAAVKERLQGLARDMVSVAHLAEAQFIKARMVWRE